MLLEPRYILLTVVAGESRTLQRRLEWGVALPRWSVGTHADWEIRGEGIADVHLYLSFDGRRLRASATSDRVSVHGSQLCAEGQELEFPFELGFGSARLAGHLVSKRVSRTASSGDTPASPTPAGVMPRGQPALATLDLASSERLQTGFLDLASLREPAVAKYATLGIGEHAPLPVRSPEIARETEPDQSGPTQSHPKNLTSVFQIASAATLSWPLGKLELPRAANPSFTDTLCDGGALRAYARQLAAAANPQATPATPASSRCAALPPRGKLELEIGLRQALQRCTGAALACAHLARQRYAGIREHRRSSWRVLTSQRRWLGMAAGAGLLSLAWCAVELAVPEYLQPSAARALGDPPTTAPSEPPAAPNPARTASLPAAPVAASSDSAMTSRSSPPNSPARAAGGEPSATGTLELEAFRAAHAGNLSEATALYTELARRGAGRVFEHAARLLREGRVHKP